MGFSRMRRLADRIGDPATIVGVEVHVSGSLAGRGHFLILGQVTGDSTLDGAVTIAEGARWEGTLVASDVIIAGEVVGDVVAGGRVEIRPNARIEGTVTGAAVAIAEGAIVDGALRTTTGDEVHQFIEKRAGATKPGQPK